MSLTRRSAILAGALSVNAAPDPGRSGTFTLPPDGRAGWAVAADGQRIRYDLFGAGDLTLVFIHGWTCDRSYWFGQIAPFAREYRVLTVDLVGHGQSDKTRGSWSIEALGDDVARSVRAAGAKTVVLVGHSMGGPVAMAAARCLGASVSGVVTVDIYTTLPPPIEGGQPSFTPGDYRRKAAEMIRGKMFLPTSDPKVTDTIVKAMTAGSPDVAINLSQALGRYDARAALAALKGTPLSMIDAGSRVIDVKALRACHPEARIFTVENTGHFVMLDDPDTFNGLLRTEVALMTGRVRSW